MGLAGSEIAAFRSTGPLLQRGEGRPRQLPAALVCTLLLIASMVLAPAWVGAVDFKFDGECGTKNWFGTCSGDRRNWDPDALPGENDNALIEAGKGPVSAGAGNGVPTIRLKSLQAPGGLTIGSIDLSLVDPSSVNDLQWFDNSIFSGAIGATPGLTISGASEWKNNGELRGIVGTPGDTATLFRNLGTIQATGTGIIDHAGFENETGGEITISSTLALKPDSFAVNRGTWVLANSGQVSRFDTNNDPDTALFTNAGTLRKTGVATTDSSNMEVRFVSDAPAAIEVIRGNLTVKREALFGGPISVSEEGHFVSQAPATALHTFHGEVHVNGTGNASLIGGMSNRHRVDGMLVFQLGDAMGGPGGALLSNVDLELSAEASLMNRGTLDWGESLHGGGSVHGEGEFSNGSAALLRIRNLASIAADLSNLGRIEQSDHLIVGNSPLAISNLEGAVWELRRGAEIQTAPGTNPKGIDSAGIFRATADSQQTTIQPPLTILPHGRIEVGRTATLTLSGGGRWSSEEPVRADGVLVLAGLSSAPRTYVVDADAVLAALDIGGAMSVTANSTLRVEKILTASISLYITDGAMTGPGEVDARSCTVTRGQLGDPVNGFLTLTNHGVLMFSDAGNQLFGSVINPSGGDPLEPPGLVFQNLARLTVSPGSTIDNTGGMALLGAVTLEGSGNLRNAGILLKTSAGESVIAPAVDNTGTIDVEQGSLKLTGPVTQVQGNTLAGGTWSVREDASMTIIGAAITIVGPGANVHVGGVPQTGSAFEGIRTVAGRFRVDAVFEAPRIMVTPGGNASSGPAGGSGQGLQAAGAAGPVPVAPEIRFDLGGGPFLNEGSVEPGGIGEIGAFGIDGSYTQTASGTLRIDIGAAVHDQLYVTGNAALGGSLEIGFLDGYVPQPEHVIVAVTAASVSGTFANATSRLFVPGGAFDVTYEQSSVVLSGFEPGVEPTPGATSTPTPPAGGTPTVTSNPTRTPTPRVGDVNGDGDVDGSDLNAIITAIFAAPDDERADLNLDGEVTAADVTDWLIASP